MFTNPGNSLKIYAKILFWTFVVIGTLGGIIGAASAAIYLLAIPAGLVCGFLFGLPVYAFGTLVENSDVIRSRLDEIKASSDAVKSATEHTAYICLNIYSTIKKMTTGEDDG